MAALHGKGGHERRSRRLLAVDWCALDVGEFVPVCSFCWTDLMIANAAYAKAIATPGVRLSLRREGA
jgi:hypothetical protein